MLVAQKSDYTQSEREAVADGVQQYVDATAKQNHVTAHQLRLRLFDAGVRMDSIDPVNKKFEIDLGKESKRHRANRLNARG